ncbi:TPT-domain-containing protein [Sarocladium strictum]
MGISELPVAERDGAKTPILSKQMGITIIYLIIWVASSNSIILLNKWVIDTAGFSYPILLTCWHQVFATIAMQLLARTTKLLDSRHKQPLTTKFLLRTILPIAVVTSGALICSNTAYLYLSVPFIQMLKGLSPVFVLFLTWLWSLKQVTTSDIFSILVITGGVMLASFGELEFSWLGTTIHLTGLGCEALRVVMIQALLNDEGHEVGPLLGLYYFAPACAALNLLFASITELPQITLADFAKVGWPLLLLNGAVAFLVNMSSITLIGRISALLLNLTGIAKNILLIGLSVVIWGDAISHLQIFAYSVTLLAITWYSNGMEIVNAVLTFIRTRGPWGYSKLSTTG